MDFITGLPKFEGKSVIMVLVDRITKYAHFCALSHPFKQVQLHTFVHYLIHLSKYSCYYIYGQFKSYMETQRLL